MQLPLFKRPSAQPAFATAPFGVTGMSRSQTTADGSADTCPIAKIGSRIRKMPREIRSAVSVTGRRVGTRFFI
jgi:hypothetical protein